MAEVIRMPRMSDTMEEGNIVGWLKNEGDQVESGETLAEVETDKATMELDSFTDGVLLHIAVKEGPVPIDGVIAVIGEEGEDWKAAIESAGSTTSSATETPTAPEVPTAAIQEQTIPSTAPSNSDQRVKASPLAKSIAKEVGIDLTSLKGSGDSGRIVRKDVEAALSQGSPSANTPVSATATPPISINQSFSAAPEDKAISQMRKTIARRLSESKFSAPHFYLSITVNMDKAISTRKSINEMADVKVSFNDMVIKAVAAALKLHPAINSSWLGDKIRYHNEVNIGVAVAVEDGLLVPVIRNTDTKTLTQINAEVKYFAGKAKDKKLQPDEMSGNTFTISNLGMFGIDEFTAIINPPDACILAVGGIKSVPVVKNGTIVPGNEMKLNLSCDHRVVDGATGAQFLNTVKSMLEDPIRMIV
jgi:pyruvate dehydrogenase E2 component (dihydrolipoamide acetyltransferase)